MKQFLLLASLLIAVGCTTESSAETTEVQAATQAAETGDGAAHGRHGKGRRGPPAESLAACASKAAGEACEFTHHEQARTGICREVATDVRACVPPPPAEAVAACNGKAEGDACTVTRPDGSSAESVCGKPPFADGLACAPPHGHGRGPRHGRRE